MPRVKRGTVRRAKRKKLLARAKGYYANKSKLYRAAKESVDTALKYAFVGRRRKKRDFRTLWIVRINAAAREHGLTYAQLMAGLKAAGVTRDALVTTSRQPESLLVLDGAAGALVGGASQGAEIASWIEERATAALCALAVGVCAEALRLTAEYTKARKQFDQPIATFQAVGQRAADAFIDTEAIRLTALQAAWRIDAGLPAAAAVAGSSSERRQIACHAVSLTASVSM